MVYKDRPLPEKKFFKIGEVAELVGVKPHILRYWEDEFSELKPMKTRGAHRVYRKDDLRLAMKIHELVHQQGFTVPGARKYLRDEKHGKQTELPLVEQNEVLTIRLVRKELAALRDKLARTLDDLSGR